MPAHMPSTATPVRYEFKAKSLWTKVDKAQPLKNLARRFAVAVRLYSRGVRCCAPCGVRCRPSRKQLPKRENENGAPLLARRLGVAYSVLCVGGCKCFFACAVFSIIFRVVLVAVALALGCVLGCVDLRRVDKV